MATRREILWLFRTLVGRGDQMLSAVVHRASAVLFVFLIAPPVFAQNSLILTDAPTWMHYFCDSSEPDPAGSASLQGVHCFSSLTVPAGATLNVTNLLSVAGLAQDAPRGALFAFVNGTCSVYGTISAHATNTAYANAGASGGGGGGASTANAGQPGIFSSLYGFGGVMQSAPGGNGGNTGVAGSPGNTPIAGTQKFVTNLAIMLGVLGGAAGGAGGIGGGGAAAGGFGGGSVVLVCNTIDFGGAIDVSGGSGGAGSQGGGGGGGGGGGVVLMAAGNYLNDSGSITLAGGPGGPGDSGAGAGGSGGAGWSKQFTLQ